jgi:putative addiction module component (TIGR02574 family)
MTKSAEAVLADALSLSEEERAEIAEKLLASLDGPPDPDVDAAWEAEIRRRVAALDAGTMTTEPWETALQRIEAELRKR